MRTWRWKTRRSRGRTQPKTLTLLVKRVQSEGRLLCDAESSNLGSPMTDSRVARRARQREFVEPYGGPTCHRLLGLDRRRQGSCSTCFVECTTPSSAFCRDARTQRTWNDSTSSMRPSSTLSRRHRNARSRSPPDAVPVPTGQDDSAFATLEARRRRRLCGPGRVRCKHARSDNDDRQGARSEQVANRM